LIYDIKGRFCVHRITAEEAKVSVKVDNQKTKEMFESIGLKKR
jgi:ribosomal protein S4E